MVVRSAVDAYVPSEVGDSASSDDATVVGSEDAELASLLSEVSINKTCTEKPPSVTSTLKVIHAGMEISQSQLIQSKTRNLLRFADGENFEWTEAIQQLKLSATPYLYLGLHTRGTFSEIRKIDMNSEDIEERRKVATDGLRGLA